MKLSIAKILNLTEEQINNSKIEVNTSPGSNAPLYMEDWLSLDDEVKESGIHECSYWGWKSKKARNFAVGQVVFSFIRLSYSASDEWLFVSAGKILEIPHCARAKVEIIDEYKPFFGRLVMKYKKTDTFGNYIFNASTILSECTVKEILPVLYTGEKFEGYDKVHLPFRRLSDIFSGKIMPEYCDALKSITGVYCLTDTNTGKLYIGSATGSEGVAQRWGNYFDSKHGGNKRLIELHKEKGDEYFEKYFTYSLIEYFGLSYDPEKVKEREQYWKKCFSTIQNGYNDN